jgi:hypothetical protein
VDGAKGLKLSKDGEIIIQTGLGDLKLSKPIAWQEKDGKKLPVEVSYKLIGKNRYSFEVAKADPSLPIVIDPILQSTYLGGRGTMGLRPCHSSQNGRCLCGGKTRSTTFLALLAGRRQAMETIPVGRLCGKAELRPYPNSPIHLPGRKRWRLCQNALAIHLCGHVRRGAGVTEDSDADCPAIHLPGRK